MKTFRVHLRNGHMDIRAEEVSFRPQQRPQAPSSWQAHPTVEASPVEAKLSFRGVHPQDEAALISLELSLVISVEELNPANEAVGQILNQVSSPSGRGYHPHRDRRRWYAVRDQIPMPSWMVREIKSHLEECEGCRGEVESYMGKPPITKWEILTGLSIPFGASVSDSQ